MRVCHFIDSSVAGDYFRNIAKSFSENGVELLLLELGPGNPPAWLVDLPGIRYSSLNVTSKAMFPVAIFRLAQVLKQNDIDILHTHLFYSGLIGTLTKMLHRRRTSVVLMRHHTGVVRMLGSRLHVRSDRWMAEHADHVVTVSEAARRFMLEVDGIDRNDIEVVYLGFDFDKLSPNIDKREKVRSDLGFADDDFVIGYVANFAVGKGHLQLIKAFADVASEVPNARLLFAGRGEMPRDVVNALSLLKPGQVVMAGWRDDIDAVYNTIDIFVQPSLSEAFSQVLIEAMGVGLPVIGTDVGGASEVIESGINGILIQPSDPEAIHREVIKLYRDPRLRERLAKKGRESVRQRFSVDKMVKRHLELYERWLNR